MQFCVLGSGSKGNCTYVAANGVSLLIDAGFSGIELQRRLQAIEVDPRSLDGILLTHEHGDHVKGAAILARKFNIPLYANNGTFSAAAKVLKKVPEMVEFTTGSDFDCQGLVVHPFSVSHDTADPVGFVLQHGETSLGYCTDTGMVSRLLQHRLDGCNGLIVECNHDLEMLRNGPYPPYLQQRIRSKTGHLANGDAARFIGSLIHPGLQHVVLAHLSDANNDPSLAYDTVIAEVGSRWLAGKDFPVVSLALQDRPGEFVDLTGGVGC